MNDQIEHDSESPIKHVTIAHANFVEEVVFRETSERNKYGIFESVPNLGYPLYSSNGETTVACKSAEQQRSGHFRTQFGPRKARTPSKEREDKQNKMKLKEIDFRFEDNDLRMNVFEEDHKDLAESHRNLKSGFNEEKFRREDLEKQFHQEKVEREKLQNELKDLNDLINESGVAKRVTLYKQFKELAENTAEIHKFKFCQILYLTLSTVFFASTPISQGVIKGNLNKNNNVGELIFNVLGDLAQLIPIAGTGVSIGVNFINAIYKEVQEHKTIIKAEKISKILSKRFIIILEESLNLLAAEIAIEVTKKINQKFLDRFRTDPSKVVIKQQVIMLKNGWINFF